MKCVICGNTFETKTNKITCSKECSYKNGRIRQMEWREANKIERKRHCKVCGEVFVSKGNKQTCSDECGIILKKKTSKEDRERRKKERNAKKIKKAGLVQSENKARKMGMSYGKYMAYISGRIELE